MRRDTNKILQIEGEGKKDGTGISCIREKDVRWELSALIYHERVVRGRKHLAR